MKNPVAILFFTLMMVYGCASKKPASSSPEVKGNVSSPYAKFSDQSTWVLGYFVRDQLTREPHSEWFVKGYDEYVFNSEAVNRLLEIPHDGITIKIVLGTWCPDSRREVPRFIRIADIWNFPMNNITFIGVDNAKLSPVGEYEMLDIQRVPTFIIYKNNVEAGRIIENPVTSLEQDMVNILTGKE
jgi:thiol-disulfide isomerase/thioredoxin